MIDPSTGKLVQTQLGSPHRIKTIYRANMRSARAAGQWDRAQRTKETRPFFVYRLGPAVKHRESHAAQEGVCLPVDDLFWDHWFPPNAWNCKCRVRQITKYERDNKNYRTERPNIPTKHWTNKRTGKTLNLPEGLTPEWSSNPGKDRYGWLEKHKLDPSKKLAIKKDVEKRFPNMFKQGLNKPFKGSVPKIISKKQVFNTSSQLGANDFNKAITTLPNKKAQELLQTFTKKHDTRLFLWAKSRSSLRVRLPLQPF